MHEKDIGNPHFCIHLDTKTRIDLKYYLKHNDSMDKVCEIFDCKKSTLKGWIDRYRNTKNITRKNRKPISYKIKNKLEVL